MDSFKQYIDEAQALKFYNLLPKKVRHAINRFAHQDKYKGALAMYRELKKNKDVKDRNLPDSQIKGIAADFFKLSRREFDKILDRKTRYEAEEMVRLRKGKKEVKVPKHRVDFYLGQHYKIVEAWETNLLIETPLSPSELEGKHGKTKELRVDILKKLIIANKPLKMVKGKGYPKNLFLVVDKKMALANLDQFNRDSKSFSIGVYKDKTVMSNHILKSKAFGGESGGTSAGTKATEESEAAQCLWCAALLGEGHTNPIEYFNDEILAKYKNRTSTSTSLKKMLGIPDDWKYSAYHSAVLLIDKGFITKNHTFHRDDKVMNGIYAKKVLAYKNNDMKNLNNDKWNPGDIWAVDSTFNLKDLPIDSVKSLNGYMLKKYIEKSIVGISLKKIEKAPATYKEYNLKLPPETDDYKVQSYGVKGVKRGTFWSGMDTHVISKEGMVITTKRNKELGSNKIEIKGKAARGGSMGWGPIQDSAILSKIKGKLPNTSDLKKEAFLLSPKKKGAKPNARAALAFYKRVNALEPMTRATFNTELATKDAGWIMAKSGAMHFIELFVNNKGAKANRFMTKLINYAGSKSEDASVYIKVGF